MPLTSQQVRTLSHGKYQLDVTACDVADVVRHAGGWLYDRAMAGWDVAVTVTGNCDVTPLRILGVRTERPVSDDDDAGAPPRALALAASAVLALAAAPAQAASSKGCENGGFRVIAPGATVASTDGKPVSVPASALTGTIQVRGRYQQ